MKSISFQRVALKPLSGLEYLRPLYRQALQLNIIFLFSFLISGCLSAEYIDPYITDEARQHPMSDTAVFSAVQFSGNILGQIISVDGVETSCWRAGCPGWVRVTPGDHVFKVRFSIFYGINSYKHGEDDLHITHMEAKHVYDTVFTYQDNQFSVAPRDLGEEPEYGMNVGLKGVNQRYVSVRFK
ncbi:hypothetical protein [Pseudomonas kilonensis]|uniref:hypothetical protein n=1 Tax=Pseudomonas kilonensis TaxID=132476 RepID=UPI0020A01562|nr:hypothetical protein [Pseudomonas kilonensis]MCP1453378.1 hypothetical protein [Pseudomonas kilonensis]